MTINYTLEDKNKAIKSIKELYSSAIAKSDYLEYYLKLPKKNNTINEIFDGTNGRIVIDLEERFSSSEMTRQEKEAVLLDIQKGIYNLLRKAYSSSESSSFDSSMLPILKLFAKDSRDILGLDDKQSVIFKRTENKYFYEGMKVSKGLLKMFNMVSQIVAETENKFFLEEEKRFKNVTIGVKLPELIEEYFQSESLMKGKYLVLSILPQDFYSMSNGNSWTSCLNPYGEYNSGALTLAHGLDTVLSYLIKKEDLENNNFNEALIWRQLVAIKDENFLATSRPYPSDKSYLSQIVASELLKDNNLEKIVSGNDSFYDYDIEREYSVTGYIDFMSSSSSNSLYFKLDENGEKIQEKGTICFHFQKRENICSGCGFLNVLNDEDYECSDCSYD